MSNPLSGFFNSLLVKLVLIFILIILLGIPIALIFGIISERESTRNTAVNEICSKWGSGQIITGPILKVPYLVHTKGAKGEIFTSTEYACFLPDTLELQTDFSPEIRYRGIFEAVLYKSTVSVQGALPRPDFNALRISPSDVLWEDAVLSVGITDLKGIRESVELTLDGTRRRFEPGTGGLDMLPSGIHASLPNTFRSSRNTGHKYSFKLQINGSRTFQVVPVGRVTTAKMASTWPSPSFQGNFLPTERDITGKGFKASWKILELARNFPQSWRNNGVDKTSLESSAFGVDLVLPADAYQKTTRTAKYAILFIILTFLAYFLFEVLSKLRVHPFQYLLVGAALLIFYLLTLSLSEHIGFDWSYLAASLSTIGIITAYSGAILCGWKRGGLICLILTVLYGYLYILLQLEDYALLLGSLGLFLIVAGVMYLTRRINWYSIGSEGPKD